MRTRGLVVAALLLSATGALAQGWGGQPVPGVRVESETSTTRKGQPIVSGYVYNEKGMYAIRTRILVEQVDAAGAVVWSRTAWVAGDLPPFGRGYFEERVPVAGAAYRVSVVFIDWREGGGGM
ncbi:MAG: hypothetical protein HY294_03680 [Candidatus Rokubacteria bacterium]|nr:hypothetical protein [Candidatus Rokubacteria bacterium]MBI3825076.1 hypothetical protein [Candidatus Rokubacteria bacterium]